MTILPISPITPAKGDKTSADRLYQASLHLYHLKLHQTIMESWKQFAEARKLQAQDSAETHHIREKRKEEDKASRLESERRQGELRQDCPHKLLLMQSAHRQAGKFRYYEGLHLAGDSRHLALPV